MSFRAGFHVMSENYIVWFEYVLGPQREVGCAPPTTSVSQIDYRKLLKKSLDEYLLFI